MQDRPLRRRFQSIDAASKPGVREVSPHVSSGPCAGTALASAEPADAIETREFHAPSHSDRIEGAPAVVDRLVSSSPEVPWNPDDYILKRWVQAVLDAVLFVVLRAVQMLWAVSRKHPLSHLLHLAQQGFGGAAGGRRAHSSNFCKSQSP